MAKDETVWDDLDYMGRKFDRFMRRHINLPSFRNGKRYRQPFSDIEETNNEFIIRVELPGMMKEDIDVVSNSRGIVITAEKPQEISTKDGSYKRYQGFYEEIDLPEEADTELIDAEYAHGLLTLHIPKRPSARKKKITVR